MAVEFFYIVANESCHNDSDVLWFTGDISNAWSTNQKHGYKYESQGEACLVVQFFTHLFLANDLSTTMQVWGTTEIKAELKKLRKSASDAKEDVRMLKAMEKLLRKKKREDGSRIKKVLEKLK